jgi:2-methylcitrate dehydratase PrpD
VKEVEVSGGDAAYALCVPPEIKRNPRNIVDAQFSVPWNVATTLVKGKVTLEDFTEEAIKNKNVLEVAQKVTGHLDPSLSRHGVGPGRVKIIVKNGAEYSEEREFCLGSIEKPMTFDDCAKKFRECSPTSIKPLSAKMVDKVIDLVSNTEKLNDATEIIRLVG